MSNRHFGIPIDQYAGVWAMLPERLLVSVRLARDIDLSAHMQRVEAARSPAGPTRRSYPYERTSDGIASIDLVGVMMKAESSLGTSTSTVLFRQTLKNAVADADVKAILLNVDSPGGAAAGTAELYDEIAAAAAVKPVGAAVEDCGCSAAYWACSGASFISCNPAGIVGSIGTFAVLYDLSAQAAQLGVKVHVISTGPHKGAGVPGSAITDVQLAEFQRLVNDINSFFLAGVTNGRKLTGDRLAAVSDGRVHMAADAQKLGLVDFVEKPEQALARLRSMIGRTGSGAPKSKPAAPPQSIAPPAAARAAAVESDATLAQAFKGLFSIKKRTMNKERALAAARREAPTDWYAAYVRTIGG